MSLKNRIFRRPIVVATVYFFIITLFFYVLIVGIKPKSTDALSVSEIAHIDLSRNYVKLNDEIATWYPGEFYESEDFTTSIPTPTDEEAKYGTYRILLSIKAYKNYGITGFTADYAQKVYVNGELLSEVGEISDNAEGFVPKTDYYSIYFTPDSDTTEIIIQIAHFNHQYGFLKDLYLAEQEVIVERNRAEFLSNGLIIGVLMSFVIFFLGMFLSYMKRISFLWFSLTCFCAALHYAIYYSKSIMTLVPDLSWYILHKTEYLARIGFYLFIVLYVLSVLRLQSIKREKRIYFTGFAIVALFYSITPSTFYTKHIFLIGAMITLLLLYFSIFILWRCHVEKAFAHKENLIVGLSPMLIFIAWIFEAFSYQAESWYIQPYSTMIIVFFNAIALTMQFTRTQRELNRSKIREKEIKKNVEMLEQINRMKTDFLQKMAHEIKTPLTVMSGYAQLTNLQISDNEVTEETTRNLNIISAEARRLSELVSKLLEMPSTQLSDAVRSEISVQEFLLYTSVVCRGLLEKKDNTLIIKDMTELSIWGNMEMLVQVMINLAVNSNKFMENGEFIIDVSEEKDNVAFYVSDTGTGIPKENRELIFEKGFSTNNTKGLGLSICKEIAILHKGDIVLCENKGKGATFKITIPKFREKIK